MDLEPVYIDDKLLKEKLNWLCDENRTDIINLDFTKTPTTGHPLLPNKPSHTLIVGETGCGKTNAMVGIIKQYPKIDRIDVIIDDPAQCSMYILRILAEQIHKCPFNIWKIGEHPDLHEFDQNSTNILVVDDFIADKKFVNGWFTEAAHTARHHGTYIYAIVQDIQLVGPAVRKAFSHAMFFRNSMSKATDGGQWRKYLSYFVNADDLESAIEWLEEITEHDFMYFNKSHPNKKYRMRLNFKHLIKSE